MDYYLSILTFIVFSIILAQSFNLTFGLGRLFNLAHVSAYALGAYATAILTVDYQFSFWLALLVSAIVSALFALFLGAISLRLSDDYFAIGTLAFSALVSALLVNWKAFTHGVLGISGIFRPIVLGFDSSDPVVFLSLIGVLLILVLVGLRVIFKSPFGRALQAQSEQELSLTALGYNCAGLRLLAFLLSSALAGLAGSFFAVYMSYIDPTSFTLTEMIAVLTVCTLGSPGSFWGCVAAAIFLGLVPEFLRQVHISSSLLGPTRQLLYAISMFIVVYIRRDSLFQQARRV